jgi:hypothetical protein
LQAEITNSYIISLIASVMTAVSKVMTN